MTRFAIFVPTVSCSHRIDFSHPWYPCYPWLELHLDRIFDSRSSIRGSPGLAHYIIIVRISVQLAQNDQWSKPRSS